MYTIQRISGRTPLKHTYEPFCKLITINLKTLILGYNVFCGRKFRSRIGKTIRYTLGSLILMILGTQVTGESKLSVILLLYFGTKANATGYICFPKIRWLKTGKSAQINLLIWETGGSNPPGSNLTQL